MDAEHNLFMVTSEQPCNSQATSSIAPVRTPRESLLGLLDQNPFFEKKTASGAI